MTPWTSTLKAIGVEPGQFSRVPALELAASRSFIAALLLMPVLPFIPGGEIFNPGGWAVLPFGVALFVVSLVVIADYSTLVVRSLVLAGMAVTVALLGWFALARWWDPGGLVKVGLLSVHSVASSWLVWVGVSPLTRKESARDG